LAESDSVKKTWRDYLETIGEEPETTTKTYTSWYFCDNEKDALELAGLVMSGRKRATTGALWSYEREGSPIPRIGDLSVVTDFHGEALCVIRTVSVAVVPFNEVTGDFALKEGEGDGSLEHWRKIHREFFTRELGSFSRKATDSMPVVCEEFEVVYNPKNS